jgi:hypothetical protein
VEPHSAAMMVVSFFRLGQPGGTYPAAERLTSLPLSLASLPCCPQRHHLTHAFRQNGGSAPHLAPPLVENFGVSPSRSQIAPSANPLFEDHLCLRSNLQAMDLEGLLKIRTVGGYIARSLRLQLKGFKKAPVSDVVSVSRVIADAVKARIVDYPRSTLGQRPWRRSLQDGCVDIGNPEPDGVAGKLSPQSADPFASIDVRVLTVVRSRANCATLGPFRRHLPKGNVVVVAGDLV